MPPRQHVIITGNIGTGKTTLVHRLHEEFPGALALEEREGMYLADLYRDPAGYAFRSQLDFTLHLLDLALATPDAELVIQERSIFDAHDVFSRTLLEAGHIEPRDFELLARVHKMTAAQTAPTLVIFLEASVPVAYARMRERDLAAEATVVEDYLDVLRRAYARWYEAFDLCPKVKIETTDLSPAAVAAAAAASIRSQS